MAVRPFAQHACWLLAAALVACSGRSDLEQEAPPIAKSYQPLAECNAPLWVPAGQAYYGGIRVAATKPYASWRESFFTVVPYACNEVEFNRFVHVNDYYLDSDEVSHACYEHCVADGVCEPAPAPTEERPALSVSAEAAAAFCAYRGGYLPSYAQLARAGSAESLSVGPRNVLLDWAECLNESWADCRYRARAPERDEEFRPTWAPRSDPTDIGPFGHYDLFGGQLEWTRSQSSFDGVEITPAPAACQDGPLEDPVDLGDGILTLYSPGFAMIDGLQPISEGAVWRYSGSLQPFYENILSDPALLGWVGFRCAFDTQEQEP